MPNPKMRMPVFLPGSNHDWDQVEGMAEITLEGEIHIVLQHREAALHLVDLAQRGILVSCDFAYLDPAKPKEQ